MVTQLAEQFIVWLDSLAQDNMGIALAVVAVVSALGGLLLAAALRLLRALLPLMVVAGAVILCWHMGLLDQCYQWLMTLGQ
jgi:uncharacterized membrane protein